MTLDQERTQLWQFCATAWGVPVADAVKRVDAARAVDLLRMGREHVAESTEALKRWCKKNLVAGTARYLLPDDVISVEKVELLKNGDRLVTMRPEFSPDIETGETVANGIPQFCTWKWQDYDSSQAGLELRLSPPPDWSETGGLWIYASVLPSDLTATTQESDFWRSLAMAGIYWACYLATLDARFTQMYAEERRVFARTGYGKGLRPKMSPYRGTRGDALDLERLTSE